MSTDGILLIAIVTLSASLMVHRWIRGNVSFVFYGGYFLIFGAAQLAGRIFGEPLTFSSTVVEKGNALALATLVCLSLGETMFLRRRQGRSWSLRPRRIRAPSWLKAPIKDWQARTIMCAALGLSAAGCLYIMRHGGAPISGMVRTGYMELRWETAGTMTALARAMLGLSMVAMYLALSREPRRIIARSVLLLVVLVNTVPTIVFGIRAYLLQILCPWLSYFARPGARTRKALGAALFGILLVVSAGLFHLFRWSPERNVETLIETSRNPQTYGSLLDNPISDLNARYRLFEVVELFPSRYGWLYGNTYRTMLLFWLPSRLSGGLKEDTIYILGRVLSQYPWAPAEMASRHATFVGDLYINFGWFFCLGAFVWGLVFGYVHTVTGSNGQGVLHTALGSVWAYILVLALSGTIINPFMTLLTCGLFVTAMTFVLTPSSLRRARALLMPPVGMGRGTDAARRGRPAPRREGSAPPSPWEEARGIDGGAA